MKNILFIADFFLSDGILGGAELYNENLLSYLYSKYKVQKINSHNVTEEIILKNKNNLLDYLSVDEVAIVLKKFLYLKFPLNHDLILQHNSSIFYKYKNKVNSEIIGFNGKKMPEIIEEINNVSLQDYTKELEKILYQSKNKKDYAILPKLENLAYYKRGNGSYLKYL